MKRSVLALSVSLLSFAFSGSALAHYSYAGEGTWKDCGGESGSYAATLNVDDSDADKMYIEEVISLDGGSSLHMNYTIHKRSEDFYTVYDESGRKIGKGYCFAIASEGDGHWCHTEGFAQGVRFEGSSVFMGPTVYRMGSTKMRRRTIYWNDTLTHQ